MNDFDYYTFKAELCYYQFYREKAEIILQSMEKTLSPEHSHEYGLLKKELEKAKTKLNFVLKEVENNV